MEQRARNCLVVVFAHRAIVDQRMQRPHFERNMQAQRLCVVRMSSKTELGTASDSLLKQIGGIRYIEHMRGMPGGFASPCSNSFLERVN